MWGGGHTHTHAEKRWLLEVCTWVVKRAVGKQGRWLCGQRTNRAERSRRDDGWGGGCGTHNSPVVADGKQEKERREELGLGEQEGEAQEGLHRNTHSKQQL